jgi:hypothetical protein
MTKKKARKKQKGIPETKGKPAENKIAESAHEQENPFDFGGLPQRDLKKNLGCG